MELVGALPIGQLGTREKEPVGRSSDSSQVLGLALLGPELGHFSTLLENFTDSWFSTLEGGCRTGHQEASPFSMVILLLTCCVTWASHSVANSHGFVSQ